MTNGNASRKWPVHVNGCQRQHSIEPLQKKFGDISLDIRGRFDMRIERSRTMLRTERFKHPLILLLIAAKNVGVAVVCSYTEVLGVWSVPLIFDRVYKHGILAKPELDRPFVHFLSRIAFDAN